MELIAVFDSDSPNPRAELEKLTRRLESMVNSRFRGWRPELETTFMNNNYCIVKVRYHGNTLLLHVIAIDYSLETWQGRRDELEATQWVQDTQKDTHGVQASIEDRKRPIPL